MSLPSNQRDAQAVILAGGLGTRLWPITKEVPKPMVPIAGAPYLEHQLRYLRDQGITNIILLIGYLGEQIEQHFGDGERFGLSIQYAWEKTPLGTGGALRAAQTLLADSFLLLYGDSFLPLRYCDVLDCLQAHADARGAVVVYDNSLEDTSVNNNIALDAENYLIRYDKLNRVGLTHVEAGVLALRRAVVELIPPGKVSLEQEIFPTLIAARQLVAYPTRQRFYDIGTPERLQVIESYFSPPAALGK